MEQEEVSSKRSALGSKNRSRHGLERKIRNTRLHSLSLRVRGRGREKKRKTGDTELCQCRRGKIYLAFDGGHKRGEPGIQNKGGGDIK